MALYQWIYLIIELAGLVVIAFIFYHFAIAIYQSAEIFVNDFSKMLHMEGWRKTTVHFFLDFLKHFSSLIFLMIAFFIFPVVCILMEEIVSKVFCGNLAMSKFINHIPETIASVAFNYTNSCAHLFSVFQRIFT